jgi:hypothetical protein
MSKDMRKMIDKVKNFNQFISENYNSKIRLYRIENPNIPYDESREGIVSNKDLIGQFFTDNINDVSVYIRKNQKVDGIRLVYVDTSKEDLETYHVSKNPKAPSDVEGNNWLIPNTIKRNYVDLSDLPKVTGNLNSLKIAKQELENKINGLN